jgi:hypothetical protein
VVDCRYQSLQENMMASYKNAKAYAANINNANEVKSAIAKKAFAYRHDIPNRIIWCESQGFYGVGEYCGAASAWQHAVEWINAEFGQTSEQITAGLSGFVWIAKPFDADALNKKVQYFLSNAERDALSGIRSRFKDNMRAQHDCLAGVGASVQKIALFGTTDGTYSLQQALTFDILVAERGVQFLMPDIFSSMSPAITPYDLLVRRLGRQKADYLTHADRRVRSAEELYEIGLIGNLVAPGDGVTAVVEISAVKDPQSAVRRSNLEYYTSLPCSLDDLLKMTDNWFDALAGLVSNGLGDFEGLFPQSQEGLMPHQQLAA